MILAISNRYFVTLSVSLLTTLLMIHLIVLLSRYIPLSIPRPTPWLSLGQSVRLLSSLSFSVTPVGVTPCQILLLYLISSSLVSTFPWSPLALSVLISYE